MAYSMSDLLQLVVSEGASDLHVRVGTPPVIRVHGILHRVEGPPLTPEDRAWGLPGRDEYSAVFARTLERDVRPRLARLDLALD